MGKKKFNMEPKKGIKFLIEHHLIQETAEDIAHFLYKGEGLNKTAIGDYLGEKIDLHEAVLKVHFYIFGHLSVGSPQHIYNSFVSFLR